MQGRVYIASLGAGIDDRDSWVEIGRLTEDGIQYPEGVEAEEVIDLLGGFMFAPRPEIFSYRGPAPDGFVDVERFGSAEPLRVPASAYARGGHILGTGAEVADPVEQIDRALAGLCPCGAEPVEEFHPYCSYDCKPNIRGAHTDTRETGELATPMRWRPDLVTAADEVEMTDYTDRIERDGLGHQVWLYPGGERVQLRVDDGFRFIGADMDRALYDSDSEAVLEKWEALRRQFHNERHLEPGVPAQGFTLGDLLDLLTAERQDRLTSLREVLEERQRLLGEHMEEVVRNQLAAAPRIIEVPEHIHWAMPPAEHGLARAVRNALPGFEAFRAAMRAAGLLSPRGRDDEG